MSLDLILMLPPGYGFDAPSAAPPAQPSLTVPGPRTAEEHEAADLSATQLTYAGASDLEVELSSSDAAFTLAVTISVGGLTFTVGGSDDAYQTLRFHGSLSAINTALAAQFECSAANGDDVGACIVTAKARIFGDSVWRDTKQIAVTVTPLAPSDPAGVPDVGAPTTSIDLTWTVNTAATGGRTRIESRVHNVGGYAYLFNTDALETAAFTAEGLSPGTAYDFGFYAYDEPSAVYSDPVYLLNVATDNPPVITVPSDDPHAAIFTEGDTGELFTAEATDADVGDTSTWSLTGADAALFAIGSSSGIITFVDPAVPGLYTFNVVDTDLLGATDSAVVNVTVKPLAPTVLLQLMPDFNLTWTNNSSVSDSDLVQCDWQLDGGGWNSIQDGTITDNPSGVGSPPFGNGNASGDYEARARVGKVVGMTTIWSEYGTDSGTA